MVFRKNISQTVETTTLVHIFQECKQEAATVIAIMENTVDQLKRQNPDLTEIYYRSDNAGCYHSSAVINAAKVVSHRHGIPIKRIDFSDPQGGKDVCDRQAARIKEHVKRYLNEGHDVQNAVEFHQAIESYGGLQGVVAQVCEVQGHVHEPIGEKIENISLYNNFSYTETGVIVWKAYSIGTGKHLNLSVTPNAQLPELRIVRPSSKNDMGFKTVQNEPQKAIEDCKHDATLLCPEDGCILFFSTHESLMEHLCIGNHQRDIYRAPIEDRSKLMYAAKIIDGKRHLPHLLEGISATSTPETVQTGKGWALRQPKKQSRFSDKQQNFLNAKFLEGEKEKHLKANADLVSKQMRCAKDPSGRRLFEVDEFLTTQQVASFFTRLAAKRRVNVDLQDMVAASTEQAHDDIILEITQKVGRCHPIMCEEYNLCDLYMNRRLQTSRLPLLKHFCKSLQIQIDEGADKRLKETYFTKLCEYLSNCSCQTT